MTATESIGIDLGGTKMAVGVYGDGVDPLWQSREPSTGLDQEELVELIAEQIAAAHQARPAAAAVGLGVPARIDHERGFAISAVNLPIENLPVREAVGARTELPVFVDNDANVAAFAEHRFGVGRGCTDLLMLTLGTGVGGGVVIDGEIFRGASGAGAELGHVSIEYDGPPCQGSCPNRGCLETYASGTAMGREAATAAEREPDSALGRMRAEGRELDGAALTEAAAGGDEVALAVFDLVGERLGAGLASLVNIFEPQRIVIGGGASAAGDLLLDPARRALRDRALRPMSETPLLLAELGEEAGAVGAAAMARAELGRGA